MPPDTTSHSHSNPNHVWSCLQFVREFAKLGLTRSVGGVLALALARELTPVVTAIILAGRVGSAFAAELGTMQVGVLGQPDSRSHSECLFGMWQQGATACVLVGFSCLRRQCCAQPGLQLTPGDHPMQRSMDLSCRTGFSAMCVLSSLFSVYHLIVPQERPSLLVPPQCLQVSEQVDSLRVLFTDPVDYLVTPRVLASMIAGPILNVLCFCMGE